MDRSKIFNGIREKSHPELRELSDDDLNRLLSTVVNTIDRILEDEDILDIDDFGSFSRRKHDSISVSFFKPSERLIDRINRKR